MQFQGQIHFQHQAYTGLTVHYYLFEKALSDPVFHIQILLFWYLGMKPNKIQFRDHKTVNEVDFSHIVKYHRIPTGLIMVIKQHECFM